MAKDKEKGKLSKEELKEKLETLKQENDSLKAKNRELKTQIAELQERVSILESRDIGGRRKHDKTWQAKYDQFVELYEGGRTVIEISEATPFSLRTCYRYKKYYDELMALKKQEQ